MYLVRFQTVAAPSRFRLWRFSQTPRDMAPISASNVDRPTVEHVLKLLESRLEAVATYGAGGCPTCHDAELRGAILLLRRMATPPEQVTASSVAPSSTGMRRRK